MSLHPCLELPGRGEIVCPKYSFDPFFVRVSPFFFNHRMLPRSAENEVHVVVEAAAPRSPAAYAARIPADAGIAHVTVQVDAASDPSEELRA